MKNLDLYADPACPWSWLAVRWLTGVAAEREVSFSLRSFSLWKRDGAEGSPGVPPMIRAAAVATSKQSLRLLRVFEALRAAGREPEIWPLYVAWGEQVFRPGLPTAPDPSLVTGLATAIDDPGGVEIGGPAVAADDDRWDSAVEDSMASLRALAGTAPLVPTLVDGKRILFTGAVLAGPLSAEQGLEVWDALELLSAEPAFIGLAAGQLPIPAFV